MISDFRDFLIKTERMNSITAEQVVEWAEAYLEYREESGRKAVSLSEFYNHLYGMGKYNSWQLYQAKWSVNLYNFYRKHGSAYHSSRYILEHVSI